MNIFDKPNLLLRIEGLVLFALSIALYHHLAFSWNTFWYFILIPDVALLAYIINANVGATAYNVTHSTLLPSLLTLFSLVTSDMFSLSLAVIWFTHIGFDRLLGYGLKYTKGFQYTHLGKIGASEKRGEKYHLPSFCVK